MKKIYPEKLSVGEFHAYLLGTVVPRPIAFASTVDKDGEVNLSPFSYFNAFSARPPILIFSPARRVRDNSTKHTLENVKEHPEVVINIVSYDIAEQMSFTSYDFEKGENEFTKSGLTEIASEMVQPPRVGESPVAFECKVNEVISFGELGGAGNLIVCQVLLVHIDENVLDQNGKVDPFKLDAIGRMGANWYVRAQGDALFEIKKPAGKPGLGIDQFPESVRMSKVLTGNDLGRLAHIDQLPTRQEIAEFKTNSSVTDQLSTYTPGSPEYQTELHHLAREFLEKGEIENAWKVLLF